MTLFCFYVLNYTMEIGFVKVYFFQTGRDSSEKGLENVGQEENRFLKKQLTGEQEGAIIMVKLNR